MNGYESDWAYVESGVFAGTILGPVLFVVYVDDIDELLSVVLFKFADDMKLVAKTSKVEDCQRLQRNLDIAFGYSETWQLSFNPQKCSVVHFGPKNLNFCYEMGGTWIQECNKQKDLGILISKDLKVASQCQEASNKASRMLGLIKRNVMCKSVEVISLLYKSYVLPHLEYCVQAWAPFLKKDLEKLEKVQRRATKIIPGIRHLSYEERLRKMKLHKIETRILQADMLLTYRIIRSQDEQTINKFFDLDGDKRCRGHKYKIVKKHCNLDIRKNFFSFRVINFWNELPEKVVESCSLESGHIWN